MAADGGGGVLDTEGYLTAGFNSAAWRMGGGRKKKKKRELVKAAHDLDTQSERRRFISRFLPQDLQPLSAFISVG